MKSYVFFFLVGAIGLLLTGCENTQQPAQASTEHTELSNPLIGAWKLVYGEYYSPEGDTTIRNEPEGYQLKMFSEKHLTVIWLDGSHAVSGTYQLDGNQFTETFEVFTNPDQRSYIGSYDIQEWRLEGDTLYFEGPSKVMSTEGEDLGSPFGTWIEKRIRAE